VPGFFVFDAFGEHGEAEAVSEVDDGLRDGEVFVVGE
jgi:hypothetical protein